LAASASAPNLHENTKILSTTRKCAANRQRMIAHDKTPALSPVETFFSSEMRRAPSVKKCSHGTNIFRSQRHPGIADGAEHGSRVFDFLSV
jgi:hypothetical protein